jgi:DNA-directed RNA polymerase I and III subunit RPAC2
MHFRIQTTRPAALDVLKRGIEDLEKLCDHTLTVFQVKLSCSLILFEVS